MRRTVLAAALLLALPAVAGAEELRVCPSCRIRTLSEALGQAAAGDVVVLASGRYVEAGVIRADRVTLKAEPGARLDGIAAEGKAALVVKGNDTVIEGLECSNIRVPDRNGACVRLEGRNLTLRNVHFHDSEEGVLAANGTGTILIEGSRLERLGAAGRAHALYINHIDSLVIRRSVILSSADEGHEIKSRAAQTVIEDCVVASLDGHDSRLLDVPNGGEVVIRGSVLEKGAASSNPQLIGFGLEGIDYPRNSLRLDGNTFIIDRAQGRLIGGDIAAELSGNVVVGGDRIDTAAWYPNRKAAGMAAYPLLPPLPQVVRD